MNLRNDVYGSTFYYVLNAQGDVTGMTNSEGKLVISYTYDAWGRWVYYIQDTEWSNVLGGINPLLYRGYLYDIEIGLYYLQSRYYDMNTHRFLNADAFTATGQGLLGNNMFAYCNNNPVNLIDPVGSYPCTSVRGDICQISIEYYGGGGGGALAIAGGMVLAGVIRSAAQATANVLTSAYREVREFSKMMREELSDTAKKMPHVHHIAPPGNFSTRSSTTIQNLIEIRGLFIDAEINIYIDPMNLMLVSAKTHASLHTDSYIADVHARLMSTDGSKWEMYGVLFWLRLEIAAKDAFASGY